MTTSVVLGVAAFAYAGMSVIALFFLRLGIGFCDDAERSCATPWTPRRVVVWTGWFLLGVTVMTGAAASVRPERGLPANARLATAPVLAGLAIALLTNAANDH